MHSTHRQQPSNHECCTASIFCCDPLSVPRSLRLLTTCLPVSARRLLSAPTSSTSTSPTRTHACAARRTSKQHTSSSAAAAAAAKLVSAVLAVLSAAAAQAVQLSYFLWCLQQRQRPSAVCAVVPAVVCKQEQVLLLPACSSVLQCYTICCWHRALL